MTAFYEEGSEPLIRHIVDTIRGSAEQAISFYTYMQLCLYHPEYGYYMSSRTKIGKEGDYYTSSSVGTIMGELLAAFLLKRIEHYRSAGKISIVEWGGGTGRLASSILDEIERTNKDVYHSMEYIIVEESSYHREIQTKTLANHAPRIRALTAEQWFESGSPKETIVISNELLDAFPVHRVRRKNEENFEIYVAWDEQRGAFYESLHELEEGPITRYMDENRIRLKEGQTADINLAASEWIERIGRWMEYGDLITIDYGDISEELYAEHRMNGTFVCYHKHVAHDDPYRYIGEQDMTSHVNFSSCIRSGEKAGFGEYALLTQKQFLIDNGILHKLQDNASRDPFHPAAKRNRTIRQILISDQMSELFKVLIQSKR